MIVILGWCLTIGEREAYLSCIQHKILNTVYNPKHHFLSWFGQLTLSPRTPKLVWSGHFRWINHKHIEGQVFVLERWEKCLRTIPSSQPARIHKKAQKMWSQNTSSENVQLTEHKFLKNSNPVLSVQRRNPRHLCQKKVYSISRTLKHSMKWLKGLLAGEKWE